MSYDFRLFKKKVGEDPLATAQADSDVLPDSPPDPQKEALKQRVADALRAHNPKLEVFQLEHEKIAKSMKISVEEAQLKYRYLELDEPLENTDGIQIILYDDEASLTVPYWHDGARAMDTFRKIWGYWEIISRETGYLIYDPQLGRVFEPFSSFADAMGSYAKVVQQMGKGADKKAKVPWWKFW